MSYIHQMKTESNLLRLPSNLGNCEQGICTKRSIQVLRSVDLNVSDFTDLNEWSSLDTLEPDVSDFTDLSEIPMTVLMRPESSFSPSSSFTFSRDFTCVNVTSLPFLARSTCGTVLSRDTHDVTRVMNE
jgi:hypothetical protein